MRLLRITVLQGAFFPVPPVRGGAVEKLWYGLAREFAEAGHTVTQLSRAVPELPATSREHNVRHVRLRGYDQPAGLVQLKLRDWLYTWRALRAAPDADVIVTNTFWAPVLARRRHGAVYVSVERMPKGQMKLYRRCARLRACSQAVAAGILREAAGAAAQVKVIPNPLPFVPEVGVNWAGKGDEMLYVGRLHPAKGVELLLAAFALAKQQGRLGPGWRLTLVGPVAQAQGGGGEAWWRTVSASFVADTVAWIGPVYALDTLNEIYHRARVLAYPTLDESGEAMPIAPLEGMAWGCVPVVSALACFRDYVVPNQNGVVFDHRDPHPVAALADALVTAAGPSGPALAQAATAVRASHGLPAIAGQFMADFATLVQPAAAVK